MRDRFGLPGMSVLQFAFDGKPDNPHLPRNHPVNGVAYTGTHDNDTTVGWYAKLSEFERELVHRGLGLSDAAKVPEAMIDATYGSPARLAVLPMQDLLGLDSASRMNTPGTAEGNWRWRFDWSQVDSTVAARSLQRAQEHSSLGVSSLGVSPRGATRRGCISRAARAPATISAYDERCGAWACRQCSGNGSFAAHIRFALTVPSGPTRAGRPRCAQNTPAPHRNFS